MKLLPALSVKVVLIISKINMEFLNPPVCKMSTESMGSLDNVHVLPGHCPWNQWKVWTKSMDTQDKVQGAHSDWTMSMDSLSGHCPLSPWTMSMDFLDNIHGFSGKCGDCPLIPWTKSGGTEQCPLNPWAPWTLSMDKVHSLS